MNKPRIRIIAGRPVSVQVAHARQRFGQPFAHEPGSTWTKRAVFFLDEWKANRLKGAK